MLGICRKGNYKKYWKHFSVLKQNKAKKKLTIAFFSGYILKSYPLFFMGLKNANGETA